ncbi:unnamed protein product [Phaeothamnion confervicola]
MAFLISTLIGSVLGPCVAFVVVPPPRALLQCYSGGTGRISAPKKVAHTDFEPPPDEHILLEEMRKNEAWHTADLSSASTEAFFRKQRLQPQSADLLPRFNPIDLPKDLISPGNDPFNQTALAFTSIGPVFSYDECDAIVNEAEQAWAKNATSDFTFPLNREVHARDLPWTCAWLAEVLADTLLPALASAFPAAVPAADDLRVYDAIVIKYDAAAALGAAAHQPVHADAALVSFNVALSDPGEYVGGGTFIEALGRSLAVGRGGIVVHASAVRHAGYAVTAGVRYVLVGFVSATRLHYREHARVFKMRGMAAREAGDFAAAACLYRLGLQINDCDPELWTCLGVAAGRAGDVAEALRSLRRSVVLNPRDPGTWNSLGAAILAAEDVEGSLGVAVAEAAAASTEEIKESTAATGKAEAMAAEEPAQALACFQRAMALGGRDAAPFLNAGLLLARADDFGAAATALREGLALAPEHPDMRRLLDFTEQQMAAAAGKKDREEEQQRQQELAMASASGARPQGMSRPFFPDSR